MIEIERFDHVSMAVPSLLPQITLMERLFGFRLTNRFEEPGYFGASLLIPGESGVRWEIIAPSDKDSFLHRFLQSPRGPGLHHVAIEVSSTAQAAEAIRNGGSEPYIPDSPASVDAVESDSEADDAPGIPETTYLHPQRGGRGFLWQLNAATEHELPEPFEDDSGTTLGIVNLHHLGHVTPDRHDLAAWYERLLGCQTVWGDAQAVEAAVGTVETTEGAEAGSADTAIDDASAALGVATRVLQAATQPLRFEAIEPTRATSSLAGFLEARGETMHHVTFEVRDWTQALAACRAQRIEVLGARSGVRDGARWNEAFLRPQHVGGVLVQLFWQEQPGAWI